MLIRIAALIGIPTILANVVIYTAVRLGDVDRNAQSINAIEERVRDFEERLRSLEHDR